MMDKREVIMTFKDNRPKASAVFGYGSGVITQANNAKGGKMIDVIFVVDDMILWHQDNMSSNPGDYSFLGRIHFSRASAAVVKGKNKIMYLSHVKEAGYTFKYGVIEVDDFLQGLKTWENIFVAGRFQKPIMEITSNELIDRYIEYNRKCALMVACLLCDRVTSIYDIYYKLCGLSYYGDARMMFAENPEKVANIVKGNYKELVSVYPLYLESYLRVSEKGCVYIEHEKLLGKLWYLPKNLLDYLSGMDVDFGNLASVRNGVKRFFYEKNGEESKAQMVEGLRSNGIVKSVPYALAKVKKRFR